VEGVVNDLAAVPAAGLEPGVCDRFRCGEPEAATQVFDLFAPYVFAFLSRFEADTGRLNQMAADVFRELGESAGPHDGEKELRRHLLRAMGSRLRGHTVPPASPERT
jgi:hypothetical protein